MRKMVVFVVLALSFLPLFVGAASFERDLFFGLKNDPQVTALQEFLRDKGIYSGPITGSFFVLTQDGVKKFQERENIAPVLGYFGPKTRARANALLGLAPVVKEDAVAALLTQIKALQEQIKALQKKDTTGKAETVILPPPSPVLTEPTPPPPAPAVASVKGAATSTFPAVETTVFKIGEFVVSNNLAAEVLFTNFETLLSDEMDSVANRNQKVYFLIREGSLNTDTLISKTEFTFIKTAPKIGEPHKSVLLLPFGISFKSGKEQRYSLWVEQMKYVRSGTFRVVTTKVETTGTVVGGGWDFVLTKEPPL